MFKLQRFVSKQLFVKKYSTEPLELISQLGKERSLNSVQLIGRVGQDPRIGGLPSEASGQGQEAAVTKKVLMFSLATNEYQGVTEGGEPKTRVDWHRIAVFQPRLQENCEKYVRQGDRIHVTGRIHYNLVKDKVGVKRYVSSIVAEDILFLTKYV